MEQRPPCFFLSLEARAAFLLLFFWFAACTAPSKMVSPAPSVPPERRIIITADDFGASKNIDEGITFAAEHHAITAISALSNFGEALPDLKELVEKHPGIGIGVHLNINTGRPILDASEVPSLVNSEGRFFTIEELLPRIRKISPVELKKELRAQILALTQYDIPVDHLSDQFGILWLYSPFFDVVVELAKEFDVPVRCPVLAFSKYRDAFSNPAMKKRGRQLVGGLLPRNPFQAIRLWKFTTLGEMERKARLLDEQGIPHPGILIASLWGEPTASNFLEILKCLPEGDAEIVVHLGSFTRQAPYPSGLDIFYFENRELELITITSPYWKEYFNYLNIGIIGYSGIKPPNHDQANKTYE